MILNDKQIKKLVEEQDMISPFVDKSISKGISHGINSFGYDLRCGSEFKIFTNIKGATADPKNFSEDNFITVKGKSSILIPPNSFALASSLEYFKMPNYFTVANACLCKSRQQFLIGTGIKYIQRRRARHTSL